MKCHAERTSRQDDDHQRARAKHDHPMADAVRISGRKRGASLLPFPPMPAQPVAERDPNAELARLQEVVATIGGTIAAQAEENSALRAYADRVLAALRACGGTRSNVTSPASPPLFLAVLARLAENGYATELARCVDVCKDARSNAQLWERIVDLPHHVLVGNEYRATRLHHWAWEGDLARVRETLARGADVNARDTGGNTALWRASAVGHLAVVCELLDRGADVDARSKDGSMALMIASCNGHTAVVLELAARGTDVNTRKTIGTTALILACSRDHVATAAALLRVGADVNAQCDEGWSALMYAAYSGYVDAVRVLLAAPGVGVNLADVNGLTALSLARAEGRAAVALLEAAGAR